MPDPHTGIYLKALDEEVTGGLKCRSLSLGFAPLKFGRDPPRQLLGS